jgi:acetyl-CoA decarbonylase/synthase, CODH/ACS complex subunit gamma
MAELSGLQIFKYLPAAKKLPEGNCKKCSFPTCMAFALKLAKGQTEIELCPFAPDELKELFFQSMKKPQKEVFLGHKNKVLIGGENVLFRHDKTFINKTAIAVIIESAEKNWEDKLKKITDFEITRINETFKIDLIYLRGDFPDDLTKKLDNAGFAYVFENDLSEVMQIEDGNVLETIKKLTEIRKKAVQEKDENFSNPVMIYFKHEADLNKLMAKASFYLCKYANLLVFEDFNEALISTLITLRQNIYTDPQKPLQVESKVYEFNNADENSLVFLTTNFALTYFAVANEIEALNKPAYLVVTPSDGMSVLTAWSAEKFTAQIVAKTVKQFELAKKVKNKKIIIPGLLSHMKEELEESMSEFEILVGPNEAYLLGDFVKTLT